jgi:C1A family cysteine protease
MKRDLKVITAFLIAMLIPCLLFASFVSAAENDLSEIITKIREKRAHWVAGDTSISRLSLSERKNRVGLRKPVLTEEEDESAVAEQTFLATVGAPGSLDWRSSTGAYAGSFVTPVKDQGNCGSCWAFATTAALESQVLMGNNIPGQNNTLNLSEQLLVSCGGAGNCGGGYIDKAANYVRDMGLPADTCFPYTATNNSCSKACANWSNNTYHITGWHWVATTNPTVDALKTALVTYGPLVTTMNVYADFFNYKSGVYSHVSGTYQGGHAILLVGYDDVGQYFIAKNSWGTGWGMAGFFQIAYSQLAGVVGFGEYTIANEGYDGGGAPSPPPPTACTYSLSPTAKTFTYASSSGTILVSTQNTCSWTAVSNVNWISISKGNTGTGSGKVTYKVATNSSRTQRTGTLTIAGLTFTVTQGAHR